MFGRSGAPALGEDDPNAKIRRAGRAASLAAHARQRAQRFPRRPWAAGKARGEDVVRSWRLLDLSSRLSGQTFFLERLVAVVAGSELELLDRITSAACAALGQHRAYHAGATKQARPQSLRQQAEPMPKCHVVLIKCNTELGTN